MLRVKPQDTEDFRKEDIKNMLFLASIVFLISFFVFIYLWRNVSMANLDLEIEKLKKEKRKLHLELESMHVSIMSSTSPEKIQKLLSENEIYLPVRTGKKIISVTLPSFETGTKTPIEGESPQEKGAP